MKQNRIPPDMDPAELNFPKTLRLTVTDPTTAIDDTIEAPADGVSDEETAVRTFGDVTEFRRLLTDRRVEVIQSLMDKPVSSIQELADRLDRNYPEVHEDVELLAEYSILYYREKGRKKAPYIPYERVEIQGTVAEAAPA